MKKKDLISKLEGYLGDDFDSKDKCCEELVVLWIEASEKFKASNPNECCLSTMRSVLHFFVEETFSKRRYSSYDSFRQIRSRKMKKKEA